MITQPKLSGKPGQAPVAATSFSVVNDATITAVTPARAAGVVDVSVTGPGGTGTLPGAFTFTAVPTPPGPTPTPPPAPSPVPVPPVPAGGSSLLVDGQPTPGLRVDPNARQDGLDITGPGFTMSLAGLGPDGRPLPLADDSVLQVIPGAQADAAGTGFAAGSEVGIFLDPPPLVTSAVAGLVHRGLGVDAGAPISLGTLKVKADGTFAGTLPIPADLPLGAHVLQAVGYSPTGQTRAVSIGILAVAATTPSIVITGTRDGRTVKVRGATKDLTRTTVVPRYHFAGEVTYKTGVARPTIDTSGNFTWSRQAGRTIYLYFAADGTRSNRLVLRKAG